MNSKRLTDEKVREIAARWVSAEELTPSTSVFSPRFDALLMYAHARMDIPALLGHAASLRDDVAYTLGALGSIEALAGRALRNEFDKELVLETIKQWALDTARAIADPSLPRLTQPHRDEK